jgi:hypothetical protein
MNEIPVGMPERYTWIEYGRTVERERIIKLFEATEKHFYEFTVVDGYTQKTHSPVCHLCERLDRIKGLRK